MIEHTIVAASTSDGAGYLIYHRWIPDLAKNSASPENTYEVIMTLQSDIMSHMAGFVDLQSFDVHMTV